MFLWFYTKFDPKQIWAQTFNKNYPFFLKIDIFRSPRFKKKDPFSSFFLKNSMFRPLNTKRVLLVVLKKKTPFYMFFVHACVHLIYLSGPPGFAIYNQNTITGCIKAITTFLWIVSFRFTQRIILGWLYQFHSCAHVLNLSSVSLPNSTTYRTWQPSWLRHIILCFTVTEAIRRANRNPPFIPFYVPHYNCKYIPSKFSTFESLG